jgi:FkbM family methyltransferase
VIRSVTVGPTGAKLRIESPPERDSFWDRVESGSWEPETFDAMHQIVSPGDKVIDVGAWIGITALYAASLGGDVIAYEPDPEAVAEMQVNLALNEGFSVSLKPVALSTESGVAQLMSESLGNSMSSLVRNTGGLADSVEVECRAIGKEAEEHFAGVRLVKLDVEGHEFELLPPMMRALRSGSFRGDLLLSTHVYPTIEKSMERLAGSRGTSSLSYRLLRPAVIRFALPLLMFRRNLRLFWSVRGAASAQISGISGGVWETFSLKRRIRFVIQPRNRELWLRWRV